MARVAAPKRQTVPKRTAAAKREAAPKHSAVRPVALPAECLIASAPELRSALLKRLTEAGNVQIDASAVQRVDTASLQVLAAFARDRRADGLPFEWLGVPACLTEAATLLDLATALGFQA
jgi:ABC-type transporter Mla MlaB component